jgi:hypothetical protein
MLEIIYRDKGYYLDLSDEFILLLSDELRIELDELEIIINDFLSRELFSKKKFEAHNILTSKRIQENYLKGCERRKSVYLIKEFLLINPEMIFSEDAKHKPEVNIIGIDGDINQIDEDINSKNDVISTQSKSKRKKSKLNVNSKGNTILPIYPLPLPSTSDLPLPLITNYESFTPNNFDDDSELKDQIKKLLEYFIISPDDKTITTFFNVIAKKKPLTEKVSKQTSFKILYEICCNWNNLDEEKKNYPYIFKKFTGMIQDKLTNALEKRNKLEKDQEKKEVESIQDAEIISTLDKVSESVAIN